MNINVKTIEKGKDTHFYEEFTGQISISHM